MTRLLNPQELIDGSLIISGRLVDASNATLFGAITINDDTARTAEYPVVYKPIAGERPLWDFPDGNLASREVAAYITSEFSGLKVVPTTVLREGPFGEGAVQQWIEMDVELDLISFAQGQNSQLRRLALFDAIINNTDRKFGHIIVDSNGALFGCDHGLSFHQRPKLRTVLWQFAGEQLSEEESLVIQRLVDGFAELTSQLRPHITNSELEALKLRIDDLSQSGFFPYPSDQWPAIPWPPV